MARKDNPNLVRTESMDELVSMMRSRFTMGTHDACAKLQCSRSWWQENVKPNLRYVFATSRAIWKISAEGLVDMSHPDQCWYDPAELKDLVEKHVRIERRSKLVRLEALVADERAYRRRLSDEGLTDRDIYFLHGARYGDARKRQGDALAASLTAGGLALVEAAKACKKRADAKWVAVSAEERGMAMAKWDDGEWRTLADRMGYGDVAETHYREFYNAGYLRCTLEIGEASRVFWLPDPDESLRAVASSFDGVSSFALTVPAEAWYAIKE